MNSPRAVMVSAAVAFASALTAQDAQTAASAAAATAPLPALLSHTQSVFIGNAGDQENADCLRAYNGFYAGVDALHHFRLVTDPADADLIVELHYEISLASTRVSGEDQSRQFRAVLIDGKTHVVLWSLTELSNYARLQRNRDKNLDTVVAALVADFGAVVSTQPQPPANNSKAHRTAIRQQPDPSHP